MQRHNKQKKTIKSGKLTIEFGQLITARMVPSLVG